MPSNADKEAAGRALEREQQNLKNLELGSVTVAAEERLRHQAANGCKPFLANLSVNELLLTRKAGYRALGQIMGSSVYHVGWQFRPGWGGGNYYASSLELDTLSQAHLEARNLAVSRLQWEARLLNAHGVVGVRFDKRTYDWGANLIEFSLVGTAIELPGEAHTDTPFLSDLTGEEFWQLHEAGFMPVGFAYGNCFWYEVASNQTRWATNGGVFGSGWQNQELVDFTHAVSRTRHTAMNRMRQECGDVGASGVVGVNIESELKAYEVDLGNHNTRTDLIIHFQVLGTAIRERSGVSAPSAAHLAVNLSDLPLRTPDIVLNDPNALQQSRIM